MSSRRSATRTMPHINADGYPHSTRDVPTHAHTHMHPLPADKDGRPMSAEAIAHRDAHRLRCRACDHDFCTACKADPYHLGKTCEQAASHAAAAKCRFCEAALKPGQVAANAARAAALSEAADAAAAAAAGDEAVAPPPAPSAAASSSSAAAASSSSSAAAIAASGDGGSGGKADPLAPVPFGGGRATKAAAKRKAAAAAAAAVAAVAAEAAAAAAAAAATAAAAPPRPLAPVAGFPPVTDVCDAADCQARALAVCPKHHDGCGHACCGIREEAEQPCHGCLSCLDADCAAAGGGGGGGGADGAGSSSAAAADGGGGGAIVTRDDLCSICWVEGLGAAPCVRLGCGHVFHRHCVVGQLAGRWPGIRITFAFMDCPLCKRPVSHWALERELAPVRALRDDVAARALKRLAYESMDKDAQLTDPGSRYYRKPQEYAMDALSYYECYECKAPYFGGRRACGDAGAGGGAGAGAGGAAAGGANGAAAAGGEAAHLLCPRCQKPLPGVKACPRHGTAALEYKCRFCCSPAVWFCWVRAEPTGAALSERVERQTDALQLTALCVTHLSTHPIPHHPPPPTRAEPYALL